MFKKKGKLIIYDLQQGQLALCWGSRGQGQVKVCENQAQALAICLKEQIPPKVGATLLLSSSLSKWKLMTLPMVEVDEREKMVAIALEKTRDFQEKPVFACQVVSEDSKKRQQLVAVAYCFGSEIEPYLATFKEAGLGIKATMTMAEALVMGINQGFWAPDQKEPWPTHYGVFYLEEALLTLIFVHQDQVVYAQVCSKDGGLEKACLDYNKLESALSRQYELPKITHCYLLAPDQDSENRKIMVKQIALSTGQRVEGLSRKEASNQNGEAIWPQGADLDEPFFNLTSQKAWYGAEFRDKFGVLGDHKYMTGLMVLLILALVGSQGYVWYFEGQLTRALSQERVVGSKTEDVLVKKETRYGQYLQLIGQKVGPAIQVQSIATTDFGLTIIGQGDSFGDIGAFGLALEETQVFLRVVVTKAQEIKKIQPIENLTFVLDLYIDHQRKGVGDDER